MLEFLMAATILDVAEKTAKKTTVGNRKERNPSGLAIRVFRDGSVYPSAEAVALFGLEYQPATVKVEALPLPEGSHPAAEAEMKTTYVPSEQPGFGFDVMDTDQTKDLVQLGRRFIFISPVSRTQPKVDLFASTTYDETGAPRSSVLEQGAKTFGADTLLPLIKDVYQMELTKDSDVDYIDFAIYGNPGTGAPWKLNNGNSVYYVPKQISRGKDKGLYTTTRREMPTFYALVPVSAIAAETQPAAQSTDTELVDNNVEQDAVAAEVAYGVAEA